MPSQAKTISLNYCSSNESNRFGTNNFAGVSDSSKENEKKEINIEQYTPSNFNFSD